MTFLDLFRDQHGVISRAQCLAVGLSESAVDGKVRRGVWEVAGSGVYRLPGTPLTWMQRAAVVCLQGAPHTALSHQSAAYFYGLDGFNRWEPRVIKVMVPIDKRLVPPPNVEVHRARRIDPKYFERRNGIAATSLSRTLVDLAEFMEEAKLDVTLDSALRTNRDLEPKLMRVLEHLDPRAYPGLSTLRELMKERNVTDSALEVMVRRLTWIAGLPRPEIHFNVCSGNRWIGEVDFAWPQFKVAIPAQSLLFHTKSKRFYRDNEQISELLAAGWMPLPTTRKDVLRDGGHRFVMRLQETHVLALQRMKYEAPGEGRAARVGE